jgi:hypothetical protein
MELAAILVTRGISTTLIAREDLVYEKLHSPEITLHGNGTGSVQGVLAGLKSALAG